MRIDDLYIDVKISECKSNDNTQAKTAIYWFLTGMDPTGVPPQRSIFFRTMKENEKRDPKRDFYFLVVNKLDTSDVFIVSLKGLFAGFW